MKYGIRSLALAALGCATVVSAFAQTAYAVDTNGDLYVVGLPSGSTSLVGNTGKFLESLAYDPSTGRLFGHDTNSTLYELSTVNGSVVGSWNTGLGNVEGMDFAGPNNLWMTDFNSPMTTYNWDTSTNSPGALGPYNTVSATGSVRAMCFDPLVQNELFYGDQPTFQTLWQFDGINPANALGDNSAAGVYAMDYAGATLYGMGANGDIFTINPLDGSVAVTANTGGQFWLGMSTLNPVPEPATMLALGGALAGLAARRKRK